MKVNIIKGPMYEQSLEKGYKAFYQILAKKAKEIQKKDSVEKAS